ncbi:hypothetical protein UC8_05590 [Roseimaritima ulvae]|uniref:Uncharacterized protein n=2 Tax=Roseimaritima ulvae TaxID=980254 RepID=A0A5B9QLD4_9BACT|nr:hypothetical protein UC8_05590 [Roseimaritima ulvae]
MVYTSVREGVFPGTSGYCPVLITEGMPRTQCNFLESLSVYRINNTLNGKSVAATPANYEHLLRVNPPNFAHLKFDYRRESKSVLLKTCLAEFDYSSRLRKLSHFLVLDDAEHSLAGPAWVMSQPRVFLGSWGGEPQTIKTEKRIPDATVTAQSCQYWQQITGDAGWAGRLAETALQRAPHPLLMVYDSNTDVLRLVQEAVALLPPKDRWKATFATNYSELPPQITCNWRFVERTSPELQAAHGMPNGVFLDLANPEPCPDGPAADAARSGVLLDANQSPGRVFSTRPQSPATPPPPPPEGSLPAEPPIANLVPDQRTAGHSPPGRHRPAGTRSPDSKTLLIIGLIGFVAVVLLCVPATLIVASRFGQQENTPVTNPNQETTTINTVATPTDDATMPGDSTTAPGDSTTAPGDSATAPGDSATTPGDSATTPGDSATAPGDSATAPGDSTTAPGDSATTPGDSATTPGDSATAPGDSATAPGDSATAPGDSATTAGDSTTAPGDNMAASDAATGTSDAAPNTPNDGTGTPAKADASDSGTPEAARPATPEQLAESFLESISLYQKLPVGRAAADYVFPFPRKSTRNLPISSLALPNEYKLELTLERCWNGGITYSQEPSEYQFNFQQSNSRENLWELRMGQNTVAELYIPTKSQRLLTLDCKVPGLYLRMVFASSDYLLVAKLTTPEQVTLTRKYQFLQPFRYHEPQSLTMDDFQDSPRKTINPFSNNSQNRLEKAAEFIANIEIWRKPMKATVAFHPGTIQGESESLTELKIDPPQLNVKTSDRGSNQLPSCELSAKCTRYIAGPKKKPNAATSRDLLLKDLEDLKELLPQPTELDATDPAAPAVPAVPADLEQAIAYTQAMHDAEIEFPLNLHATLTVEDTTLYLLVPRSSQTK